MTVNKLRASFIKLPCGIFGTDDPLPAHEILPMIKQTDYCYH